MSRLNMMFSFKGRMRRSHFWAVRITLVVALVVLAIPFAVLDAVHPGTLSETGGTVAAIVMGVVGLPCAVAYAWIDLSSSVKRLHDQGLTGWIIPLFFIPYAGSLAAFVMLGCIDGTKGPNRFGPSGKYPESVAEIFA